MTTAIIITICSLLLIAYVFDLTSSKTKIPSVILLLLLGWIVKQAADLLDIHIPNLTPLLPILGTIGLILIVLEGSLELELNKSKTPMIAKSFVVALLPMVLLAFAVAYFLHKYENVSLKDALTNVIPLCVISSSVAISSARSLSTHNKEFVIYESSLSDIIGVLFFNFFALNSTIGFDSFGHFLLELVIIIIISFVATAALSLLLNKINHHIKFAPIILLVILIYDVSKIYHLPGLIFILLFGLFLGNLDELKRFKWIEKLKPDELDKEVHKFKELVVEATFLIRALFFLLFGYLINTSELLNTDSLIWSVSIVAAIFIIRAITFKLFKIPLNPLLAIAPRGLITILLFLSIEPSQTIPLINNSLLIQIIILTALVMMFGLMLNKPAIASTNEELDISS
ncbi:cation:proton antiporter [Ferruginibacter albus]|uniref:hypothetical protein n=1 Tax=Ferruginibacter albus TaxID=2875540 RepID=UPI001CC5E850|nr:hypothetical protein [Ferruginibacter albus]UAY51307.1 hypothetical protein K9M53_11985 [Ferruginibacter albus]